MEFISSDSIPSEDENNDHLGWECLAWTLFVDGASNKTGSGARVVLQNPIRERITWVFKYDFVVSNNEAEYKALITELWMAKDLDIKKIMVFCDS